MGHRRKSREYTLQGLYMYEVTGSPLEELLKFEWIEDEIPENIRDFAEILLKGSLEKLEQIDSLIVRHSKNWKFERLGLVDKSILRLSIYEMLYLPEIPAVATINEGIELGKIYGGESSGQFINGILDAIRKSELSGED